MDFDLNPNCQSMQTLAYQINPIDRNSYLIERKNKLAETLRKANKLDKKVPYIEEVEEDTVVSLAFDKEMLYKNMVDAKADWLYNLPAWDEIFDAETKHALYLEQKKSGTVVVGKKIGRNDPCPCGSGKKYKKCCGKNA